MYLSDIQHVTYTDTELNTLHELSKVSHTATAVNAVRCLAAVGMFLSKQTQPSNVVKVRNVTIHHSLGSQLIHCLNGMQVLGNRCLEKAIYL